MANGISRDGLEGSHEHSGDGLPSKQPRLLLRQLNGLEALYLSPSIEYAGHPRYAESVRRDDKWAQVVLHVRVNPMLLFLKRPGTLDGAYPTDDARADPNFPNDEIEWVIPAAPGINICSQAVVVYGVMLRITVSLMNTR